MTATDPSLTRLASLMRVEDIGDAASLADDLGEILKHQLDADLAVDLPAIGTRRSLRDVMTDQQPPLDVVLAVKELGKALRTSKEHLLPREVGTVIYLAAVSVARARLGKRISSISDAALHRRLGWALAQPWIDAAVRSVCREGMDALRV